MDLKQLLVHLVIWAIWTFAITYNQLYMRNDKRILGYHTFAGRWKFMTWWDAVLQMIYFGFCVLNDLFGSNLKSWEDQSKRSTLQKIRDNFHASIIFPVGTFVVTTFWSIYAIDRELVYPKRLDAVIPTWLNHVMHTTVIIFVLIDKLVVYHHYPRKAKGITTLVLLSLLYMIWLFWIAFYAGIWVYPVLEVLDWPKRMCFVLGLWGFMIILYLIGEAITNFIWRPSKQIQWEKQD